jgi:Protein of unknown function (DUF2865)
MDKRLESMALGIAAALFLAAMAPVAQAQDFFSFFNLFGGHRQPPPMTPLPYAGEENRNDAHENFGPHPRPYSGGSQAFCVRTCDGRHFPISGANNQSRAATCSSFCPASETMIVYGSNIETAVTESGKPYSELPNAFRYRDDLVGGCTCNGKGPAGLAAVTLEDDPTLRRGDIVASKNGLMVADRGADRRGASLNFSPAPDSIRSHYRRVPIVAAQ